MMLCQRWWDVLKALSILYFDVNYLKILAILVALATALETNLQVVSWISYVL